MVDIAPLVSNSRGQPPSRRQNSNPRRRWWNIRIDRCFSRPSTANGILTNRRHVLRSDCSSMRSIFRSLRSFPSINHHGCVHRKYCSSKASGFKTPRRKSVRRTKQVKTEKCLLKYDTTVFYFITVIGFTTHPTLPILATCSATGSCVIVDALPPFLLKIVTCVHLQKGSLDRIKFSERGRILGVGSLRQGRLFLIVPEANSKMKVAAIINIQRRVRVHWNRKSLDMEYFLQISVIFIFL